MNRPITHAAGKPLDLKTFQLQAGTTLIEASAGTGKTYTIQYLVLDLLLKKIELSEILVVTFTEAATRELRDRLQGFLAEVGWVLEGGRVPGEPLNNVLSRARETHGEAELSRIVQRALLYIDAAPIYTIHGFCQRALQENAFAADCAFQPELCTDTRTMVEQLVRDFLRMANLQLKRSLPPTANFNTLVNRGKMLTGMLRVKGFCHDTLPSVFTDLETHATALTACRDDVETIAQELRSYQGRLNGTTYKPHFFEQIEETLAAVFQDPFAADEKVLQRLAASKLEVSFKKAAAGTRTVHPFFQTCERFIEAKEHCQEDFLRCYDAWFIREFNRLKAEQSRITYDDMIFNLDRALQAHSALRLQLRTRYRAALVDEFQDTDSRQYRIFKTLFIDRKENEEERFFAMIGDPKQSIYSFRGADVRTYLEARDAASQCFTLPTNYRSEAAVVEGVNRFFEGVDLGEADGQPAHSIHFHPVSAAVSVEKPHLIVAGNLPLPGLMERVLTAPEDSKFATAHRLGLETMVDDVATLLRLSQEGKVLIEVDRAEGVMRRPVRPGDIAVLVDQHKEAALLQDRFRKAGILAVRGKSGDIFETEEARDFLLFLLTCLSPKEDRVNALLVSPLFGKTDAGLKQLPDAERQHIHEQFASLGRSWKSGASIGTVWSKFLNQTGLRPRLLQRLDGERRLTNYLHISELVEELERTTSLSPDRLADQVLDRVKNRSFGSDSETEANLIRLESDEAAIKLLTMHASKGLEFPIVFLPSLWQKPAQGRNMPRPVSDPDDPDCLVEIATHADESVRQQRSEALRIGYVAMTRAVHLCVYYRVVGLPEPSGRSNHAHGWFDRWITEQRGGSSATTAAADEAAFLQALDSLDPIEIPAVEPPLEVHQRRLGRSVSDEYQITSYTALSRNAHPAVSMNEDPSMKGGEEEFSLDTSDPEHESETITEVELLLESFPGGVRTGTFIHEVLERCDLTNPAEWGRETNLLLHRHFAESSASLLDRRAAEVIALLERLAGTPWPLHNGETLDLTQVARCDRLHEMEFYFPIRHVDLRALEEVLAHWAARHELRYPIPTVDQGGIQGFLTGSVDLFCRANGRFYVLDWKTNSPPPGAARDFSSYRANGMHTIMIEGRYYLQALIYSVATTAYLRNQLGNRFDFDQHVGGFIYCFVRGLGAGTGWLHAQFTETEINQAVAALGQSVPPRGRSAR